MFLTEISTPEREEEIYKILLFCIECDIKSACFSDVDNHKDVNKD